MTVNQRFKQIRTELKISQEKIARILEVSASTIKNWEKGKGSPQLIELEKIHSFYPNINFQWLVTGKGEMLIQEETGIVVEVPYYEKDSVYPLIQINDKSLNRYLKKLEKRIEEIEKKIK